MLKILFVHRHQLDPEGSGGHHRAYQVHTDLINAFGEENVDSLHISGDKDSSPGRLEYYKSRLLLRLRFAQLIIKPPMHNSIILQNQLSKLLDRQSPFGVFNLRSYYNYIDQTGIPSVCMIDHPGLLEIAINNKKLGIPTVYYPQNLETFDTFAFTLHQDSSRMRFAQHWEKETRTIVTCEERLMISKLERDLIRGLGLTAQYYPYIPVGSIESQLNNIQNARFRNKPNNRTFLLLGSVTHPTTAFSFRWFLDNCKKKGLPENIKVIVAGRGSDEFEKELGEINGIEFRGKVSSATLYGLLENINGVLVPQIGGFGAVTRLSEMSCAGVPVITSRHASTALNPPPGIIFTCDEWNDWYQAMINLVNHPQFPDHSDYENWKIQQPNPLKNTIVRLMKG